MVTSKHELAAAKEGNDSPATPAVQDQSPPNSSYAFVVNVGHLEEAVNSEIIPQHHLRRATAREIEEIKRNCLGFTGLASTWPTYRWESDPSVRGSRLPEEQWRYHIITFPSIGTNLQQLQSAFDVSELELEMAFTLVRYEFGTGLSVQPQRLFNWTI